VNASWSVSAPEFVAVGLVLGAFGQAGLIRVRPLSDFPDRLLELERVRVMIESSAVHRSEWRDIHSARRHGAAAFVLGLGDVSTRAEAVALSGARIEIPSSQLKPLPDGHYYRFQVVGLAVSDESGRNLGRVREILETGANDVYVVCPEGGQGRKDEILVPALKHVVLNIDLEAGKMVVRLPRVWGE
jgi:16S rRNA processing protein RimM